MKSPEQSGEKRNKKNKGLNNKLRFTRMPREGSSKSLVKTGKSKSDQGLELKAIKGMVQLENYSVEKQKEG